MAYNFRPVERDQQYLLPVSLRDWLPEDDLAWFVLDAVDEFDLAPIYARYRDDGWGAPAFEPAMMTALLLYAYATGERSSRRIERRCRRDVAYRVIAANQTPDHATIARFRSEHHAALAELFTDVLRLCAAAGLGSLGVVAIDGTKIEADASLRENRTRRALEAEVEKILREAADVDAAEDAAEASGELAPALPAALRKREHRLERLREARQRLDAADAARQAEYEQRLAERAERAAARGGPPRGRPPKPPAPRPRAKTNLTDPDSRAMKGWRGPVQGYNAQAAVSEDGVILAAELRQETNDAALLAPMIEATSETLRRAGIGGSIGTVVADRGYWNLAAVSASDGPELLVPSPRHRLIHGRKAGPALPVRIEMEQRLKSERGRECYRLRACTVEPVFGTIKAARGCRRFMRRGLPACLAEWRLICATHNLLKLWRAAAGGPPAARATATAS